MKKRDINVLLHFKGEINLGTKVIRNKKAYNRKNKHKSKRYD